VPLRFEEPFGVALTVRSSEVPVSEGSPTDYRRPAADHTHPVTPAQRQHGHHVPRSRRAPPPRHRDRLHPPPHL